MSYAEENGALVDGDGTEELPHPVRTDLETWGITGVTMTVTLKRKVLLTDGHPLKDGVNGQGEDDHEAPDGPENFFLGLFSFLLVCGQLK